MRAARMLLDRAPDLGHERLAAAPREVEAGHRVPVAVDAALRPVHYRKELHALLLQPAAHLVARALHVLLGPASRQLVAVLEAGHSHPVLKGQLDAVLD